MKRKTNKLPDGIVLTPKLRYKKKTNYLEYLKEIQRMSLMKRTIKR